MSQIPYTTIPADEILAPGHLGCGGCGATLSMRLALKALGRKTVLVVPACCWSIIDGMAPFTAAGVPLMHTPFASAAAAASGVRAALDVKGDVDTTVCAWAGDGGTFDIGIQALSAAAERNENIIYVCYDNEAYMNTGVQRSSATPFGAWTTTTPNQRVKEQPKKDIMRILAAHGIPYAATATVAYPDDFIAKFERARQMRGTRFLHVLSPCPPGWKIPSERAIEFARLAVATRVFPLVEVEDGRRWRVTVDPPREGLSAYLAGQGRFRQLAEDGERIAEVVRALDERWAAMGGQAR
ncbi:MAG: 2-ketoisovalerate ferredoxin oxidoreductase [Acidobacteria bacterium RIFCSPLOWO2_02_FULL_67_36]|nr:MAG: 2-ketoisovalerate ferredoxin oxidoreductase [Acidobacteria bacterium RIFCSPLOWO2_02_FULL_67_36]OFW18346.1 MAG: 2-ketoisovalerate ferredoxin oxidoreductase [Acidobacteria bacterium RIFCSPLOWO2_12_FULL_66_21]